VSVICIIGARKGSKRLVGKNRRLLGEKPLYAYSLEAAIESNIFNAIILSSDDEFIIEDAQKYKEIIINKRPAKYADDITSMYDVGFYLLQEYTAVFKNVEYLCFLSPCNPLRTAKHITDAYTLLEQEKYDSLISVSEFAFPPELKLTVKDNKLERSWSGLARKNNHGLSYYPAGGMIFVNQKYFSKHKDVYTENTGAYQIGFPSSLDIDEEKDLAIARLFINKREDIYV